MLIVKRNSAIFSSRFCYGFIFLFRFLNPFTVYFCGWYVMDLHWFFFNVSIVPASFVECSSLPQWFYMPLAHTLKSPAIIGVILSFLFYATGLLVYSCTGTQVVYIKSFIVCFYVWYDYCSLMLLLLLSRFSRVRLRATPWTAAYQASPSMGFSRQEHWRGLPFPSPMHESGKWKWSCSVVSDS